MEEFDGAAEGSPRFGVKEEMDKKIIWVGLSSLAVVAIAMLVALVFSKPASFHGTNYNQPYPVAPQIELKKSNGETFTLSEQKGKIVLLFFGFTSCTDVCPTTLAELKQVMDDLGDKAKSVQVVFVSVDPDYDTPEITQNYVEKFNKGFIGLSGPIDKLQSIWNGYGVFREKVKTDSAPGYTIEHTSRIYLIDSNGNLRLSYGSQPPVEDMVNDLNILLK
jgi:protein SCO1